jgi:hypothetical protein
MLEIVSGFHNVDLASVLQHRVDAACIASVSEICTVSIFRETARIHMVPSYKNRPHIPQYFE